MIASAAGRSGAAISSTVGPNLYATAGVNPRVLEVGVFNTTTTALAVGLSRATTAGTSSGGLTEQSETDSAQTPLGVASTGYSAGPTITATPMRQATLGAAAGSGVIWTFSDQGVLIPAGTANGLIIWCPIGTGQVVDFYFVWRE